jgi:hypothetical protein
VNLTLLSSTEFSKIRGEKTRGNAPKSTFLGPFAAFFQPFSPLSLTRRRGVSNPSFSLFLLHALQGPNTYSRVPNPSIHQPYNSS